MACELVDYGIRVNDVAPGYAVTEFHFAQAPDPAARKRELEEFAAGLLSSTEAESASTPAVPPQGKPLEVARRERSISSACPRVQLPMNRSSDVAICVTPCCRRFGRRQRPGKGRRVEPGGPCVGRLERRVTIELTQASLTLTIGNLCFDERGEHRTA